MKGLVCCSFAVAVLSGAWVASDSDDLLVFISVFALGDQGAIHAYRLDLKSGELKPVHRTKGVEHPFFLAVSPDRKFMYSIHAPGQFGGKTHEQIVVVFQIDSKTGSLTRVGEPVSIPSPSCIMML